MKNHACHIRTLFLTTALVTGMTLVHAAEAFAASVSPLTTPTGEHVAAGAATFDRPAAGQLNVTQGTDRAVIDWQSFNIGKSAATTFTQPSAGSLAVNRVMGAGTDPTQILGTLTANGRIMILDRNGVLVGRDAKINVGSIVAAAGDIGNKAAMDSTGKITIKDMNPNATVENRGSITAADAGLVALVAPTVRNSGTITANLGKVALAGGDKVTVDMFGDGLISIGMNDKMSKVMLKNSGDIIAHGGTVKMTTGAASKLVDNVINTSGIVDVSSVTVKGGNIILSGNADIRAAGTLNADGTAGNGGGSIKISGKSVKVPGMLTASTGATDTTAAAPAAPVTATVTDTTGTTTADTTTTDTTTDTAVGATAVVAAAVPANGGNIRIAATKDVGISGTVDAGGSTGGGKVYVTGRDITVNKAGMLTAASAGAGDTGAGGSVKLAATHDVSLNGGLAAGGSAGGGRITVTGRDVTMNKSSSLMADSMNPADTGAGGVIKVAATRDALLKGGLSAGGNTGGGRISVTGRNVTTNGALAADAMTGGAGGRIDLTAARLATIGRNGTVDASGFGTGGMVSVNGRDVLVDGTLGSATGNNGGGTFSLNAVRDVDVNGSVLAGGPASGGTVNAQGRNLTFGQASVINAASTAPGDTGNMGAVNLTASRNATLGGMIDVSGQNSGSALTASGRNLSMTGGINASSLGNGNGGNVTLTGTHSNAFSGNITSTGGATAGNGGAVVFSTPNTATGTVDVTSAAGTAGTYTH